MAGGLRRDLSKQELFRFMFVFTSGVIYGEDHSILYTRHLQKKSAEVDASGRMREGDSLQLATKEVGLTKDARGTSPPGGGAVAWAVRRLFWQL